MRLDDLELELPQPGGGRPGGLDPKCYGIRRMCPGNPPGGGRPPGGGNPPGGGKPPGGLSPPGGMPLGRGGGGL